MLRARGTKSKRFPHFSPMPWALPGRMGRIDAVVMKIIGGLLKNRFGHVLIKDVKIRRGADDDGDPVLMVDVVIDYDAGRLDPEGTSGVTRHARSRLEKAGETAFPMFSFIAAEEMRPKR